MKEQFQVGSDYSWGKSHGCCFQRFLSACYPARQHLRMALEAAADPGAILIRCGLMVT